MCPTTSMQMVHMHMNIHHMHIPNYALPNFVSQSAFIAKLENIPNGSLKHSITHFTTNRNYKGVMFVLLIVVVFFFWVNLSLCQISDMDFNTCHNYWPSLAMASTFAFSTNIAYLNRTYSGWILQHSWNHFHMCLVWLPCFSGPLNAETPVPIDALPAHPPRIHTTKDHIQGSGRARANVARIYYFDNDPDEEVPWSCSATRCTTVTGHGQHVTDRLSRFVTGKQSITGPLVSSICPGLPGLPHWFMNI